MSEITKNKPVNLDCVSPIEFATLNSMEQSIVSFFENQITEKTSISVIELFAIARANTAISPAKLSSFHQSCCLHLKTLGCSDKQAAGLADYVLEMIQLILCLNDTKECRAAVSSNYSSLYYRINKYIFGEPSGKLQRTAEFDKQTYIDFVCSNSRDAENYYSYEQFLEDFQAGSNSLKEAMDHIIQGGHFRYADAVIQRYYNDYISRLFVVIENKYKDINLSELERSFDDVLRFNGKEIKYGSVENKDVVNINFPQFSKLIKVLYKKIEIYLDDQIAHESDFMTGAYYAYSYYSDENRRRLRVMSIINIIQSIESEYRAAIEMDEMFDAEPAETAQYIASSDNNDLFERILQYSLNRYSRSELEVIVNMLNRVCRGELDKLNRVDQLEKEWEEVHVPKNTIALQSAQINQLNIGNGSQTYQNLPSIEKQ